MSKDTDTVARLPWVTHLSKSQPCDGLRYNAMPGKATRRWGPGGINPPTGVDKYRCKNPAHWRFRALKTSMATSGVYCWSHLWSCGLMEMAENDRMMRWLERHSS